MVHLFISISLISPLQLISILSSLTLQLLGILPSLTPQLLGVLPSLSVQRDSAPVRSARRACCALLHLQLHTASLLGQVVQEWEGVLQVGSSIVLPSH